MIDLEKKMKSSVGHDADISLKNGKIIKGFVDIYFSLSENEEYGIKEPSIIVEYKSSGYDEYLLSEIESIERIDWEDENIVNLSYDDPCDEPFDIQFMKISKARGKDLKRRGEMVYVIDDEMESAMGHDAIISLINGEKVKGHVFIYEKDIDNIDEGIDEPSIIMDFENGESQEYLLSEIKEIKRIDLEDENACCMFGDSEYEKMFDSKIKEFEKEGN